MLKKLIAQLVIAILVFGIGAPVVSSTVLANNATTTPTTTDDKEPLLNSFDLSTYLKIPNGQTYLDQKSDEELKANPNTPNLKGGAIYFIIKLIELLTKIIGSFALLVFIAGGLVMMISHGNAQLQTKGKQMILYSLLGIVVAFSSLIIVTFVQSLFFTA